MTILIRHFQFINLIAKIIDKHAPLQRLSRKQKKLASKQITKGRLISVRKKMPCLELISLKVVISLKKPCFGFIPIRLQESKPYLKRFIFAPNLHVIKRIRAKHGR